jgi:hypothetical protein
LSRNRDEYRGGEMICAECGRALDPLIPFVGEVPRCDGCHWFALAALVKGQMSGKEGEELYLKLLMAAGYWCGGLLG